MKRSAFSLAFAAGLAVAVPAQALDLGNMNAEERVEFGEAVRGYLMENPQVLIEAITVLEQQQLAQAATSDSQLVNANADAIFDDGHSWVGGNLDGDITIVEFFDYRCGFCHRAFPEVEELVARDGNIRIILKELPILGQQSTLASRFAVSVHQLEGDEAYKQVHDALFGMQGDVTPDRLERIAADLGLNPEPILAHVDTPAVTDVLRQNHQLAETLGISGTPSFIFDDQMVRGYVPLDGMQQLVSDLRG